MPLDVQLNGSGETELFLLAPAGARSFPVPLVLRSTDGSQDAVHIRVSPGGAGIEVVPQSLTVGSEPQTVQVRALSPSLKRNDTELYIHANGVLEHAISLTVLSQPRVFFDGRFEARFSTGAGPYNHPRGNPDQPPGPERGWMWALEGEPDFVPEDSVPDRIEKPVGRVIRFHDGVPDRLFVRPIGVSVRAVIGFAGNSEETFTSGDPIIGMPVNLGPHSYFASNQPVSQADRDDGRLPEEQHFDGFQPIALFELHIGDGLSGSSRVGPHVPGTTESDRPRDPDFRPKGEGLDAMTPGEHRAYPSPSLRDFSRARLEQLVPEFERLKEAGEIGSVEFRNLRTRIGHLLPFADSQRRQELLDAHSDTGLSELDATRGFGWGNREIYRGMVNADLRVEQGRAGLFHYLSGSDSLHFMCVFFNFHTDEARGHCYGAIDPVKPPATIE